MSGEVSGYLGARRVERLDVEKRIRCELSCNSGYRTALELHDASDRELLAVTGIGPVALAKIRSAIDRLLKDRAIVERRLEGHDVVAAGHTHRTVMHQPTAS